MYITTVWIKINKETCFQNSVTIFQIIVGEGSCIMIIISLEKIVWKRKFSLKLCYKLNIRCNTIALPPSFFLVIQKFPPFIKPPLMEWKTGLIRGWPLLWGDSLVVFNLHLKYGLIRNANGTTVSNLSRKWAVMCVRVSVLPLFTQESEQSCV